MSALVTSTNCYSVDLTGTNIEIRKTPKLDPKKRFSSKRAQDFELLNKFLKTHIKLVFLARTSILGDYFCPKVPSRAM